MGFGMGQAQHQVTPGDTIYFPPGLSVVTPGGSVFNRRRYI